MQSGSMSSSSPPEPPVHVKNPIVPTRRGPCPAVTVNDEVRALKRILSYARSVGGPAPSPKVKKLPERKKRGRVMVWNREQVEALYKSFAKLQPGLLSITVAMCNTGMRKGEALALEWKSVDFDRQLLKIYPSEDWQPKNGQPREIPIGSALLPWLLVERRSERWVFPCATGERFVSWPQRRWDQARAAAKIGGV